ncbi:MAG: hypothetical protein NVSMB42_27300 [Herpetosiphon sp.]
MTAGFPEQHPHGGDWLRDIVFGLNDGLVTTLVFIMTVSGVTSPASLVLVALSEIVAGGVSMTLGGYLAARTDHEVLAQRIATERFEIAHEPMEERAELRAIYAAKGLEGQLLDEVVEQLTANRERWLQTMVHDELGIVDDVPVNPWRQGLIVGGAFSVGGLIPAVPLLLHVGMPRVWAYIFTALTALILGALKSRYTEKGILRAGLEFFGVVTVGTIIGIALGALLHAA